ncbi:MAG: HNH endonuclease [Verrucomicrobia bacterium]|nr:HNH endonuclease [Verrucomicrobiota bacterium]
MVSPTVRQAVRERAGRRCEYCGAPEEVTGSRYLIDHILPRSLGGTDDLRNLALACSTCNLAKSNHVSGTDPHTGKEESLFHPRKDRWKNHFAFTRETSILRRKTARGRATVERLNMNVFYQFEARRLWVECGLYPP